MKNSLVNTVLTLTLLGIVVPVAAQHNLSATVDGNSTDNQFLKAANKSCQPAPKPKANSSSGIVSRD